MITKILRSLFCRHKLERRMFGGGTEFAFMCIKCGAIRWKKVKP